MTKLIKNTKENLSTKKIENVDNSAIINMIVKDDENFLSVFSETDTPVISNEVANFIETSAKAIAPNKNLTLKIKSDCIDNQEKELYRKAIKEYYKEQSVATSRELNKSNLIALFLTIAGIFVLALAFLLEQHMPISFWAELVDIVAWVFLWEAVDVFCFKTRMMRLQIKKYMSFISMKIEYLSLKNK
ncbi:MAG: hypothetical protein IJW32_03540 [Clostridia bacterium]|nr:hypothetical protein [Clostridia bacterium]